MLIFLPESRLAAFKILHQGKIFSTLSCEKAASNEQVKSQCRWSNHFSKVTVECQWPRIGRAGTHRVRAVWREVAVRIIIPGPDPGPPRDDLESRILGAVISTLSCSVFGSWRPGDPQAGWVQRFGVTTGGPLWAHANVQSGLRKRRAGRWRWPCGLASDVTVAVPLHPRGAWTVSGG